MAYGSIYSTSRITGLSSGLDTDSLIQAAMQASQSKLDRLYQQKTSLEWKRDAYTDVRTKASDFSSKYFSALSSDNIFTKNAYKQFKVSVSDKYSSLFSIKGTANAQAGNHTITKTKLATTASLKSNPVTLGKVSVTGKSDTNKSAAITTRGALYVKETNNGKDSYRKLTAADLEDDNIKLSDIYADAQGTKAAFEPQTDENGNKFYAFTYQTDADHKTGTTLGKNDLDANASLKDFKDVLSKGGDQSKGVKTSVTDDGKLVLQSMTAGDKTVMSVAGLDNLNFGESKNTALITKDMTIDQLNKLGGKNVLDADGNLAFTINGVTFSTKAPENSADGKTIKIDKGMTVEELMTKVNESGANVNMTLNDDIGFRIQNTSTQAKELSLENVTGNFFGSGTDSFTGIAPQTTNVVENLDRTKDTIASAASKMGVEGAIKGDTFSFKLTGKDGKSREFTFKTTDTLDKMMSEINSDTELGLKMSYSQITDQFTIETRATGELAKVSIENLSDKDGTDDALAFFGIADGGAQAQGTNAMIEIDGKTIYKDSNTFTLDGMEITLKDNWEVGDTVEGNVLGAAKVGVEQDIDATVDKVKAFVNAYNELVDSLYGTISEEKDYDYEPLTEDQKDSLEKEDIEKWETEAKKGLLRNDTTIRTYLSRMRMAIFEKVGGTNFSNITGSDDDKKGLSAYDIGFNTTSYETGKYGGRITFDEDKFRAAMERDPDAVANVMAQISDSSDDAENYSNSGFVTKLFDITSDFINTLRGTNIKNTNDRINDVNDSMDTLLDRMKAEQERLYQQYAQLETLMTQYQSQSTWLTNQLAGLTTG